jgi:hypothetical protein
LSEEQTPQVIVFSGRVSEEEEEEQKDRLLCAQARRSPSRPRFYWYDFTVRGHRYRRSTQETKLARAAKAASVKLGSVIEGTDPFPSKPNVLSEFAERFDTWVEDGRLEEKTKKFYRNGWRLLDLDLSRIGCGIILLVHSW